MHESGRYSLKSCTHSLLGAFIAFPEPHNNCQNTASITTENIHILKEYKKHLIFEAVIVLFGFLLNEHLLDTIDFIFCYFTKALPHETNNFGTLMTTRLTPTLKVW